MTNQPTPPADVPPMPEGLLHYDRVVQWVGELGLSVLQQDNANRGQPDDWPTADSTWEDLGSSSRWSCIRSGMKHAAELSSMFQQERAENERLREALADAYEDILMEHSYPAGVGNLTQAEEHEHRKNNGWMHHSYMSNQEHALSVLLEHGIYEMHQNGKWYRKASTPKETTDD